MSESASERGGEADSFFTRRYGPLPGWAWAAIAAGGAGAYILYRRKQAAASTSAASTTAGGGTAAAGGSSYPAQQYDYAPQIATIQSEIQGLQSGRSQSKTTTPPTSTTGPTTPPPPVGITPGATTTISLAPWKGGVPENQQAWNADLNNIAAHYGLTTTQIETLNPQIPDPNSIAPGTLINVPRTTAGRLGL